MEPTSASAAPDPGLIERYMEDAKTYYQNNPQAMQQCRQMPMHSPSISEWIFSQFGLYTPLQRFLFGFTICDTAILLAHPDFAFDGRGYLRPWSLFSNEPNSTMCPWFLPGLLVGGTLALFF